MQNENVKNFWELYDKYIFTKDSELMPELSKLLSTIEKPSKSEQLFRPEKGWNKILAWIVLRDQKFLFSPNNPFLLSKGEVLAWCPHWDRDLFVTRIPYEETISDRILRPGIDYSGSEYQYDVFLKTHTESEFDRFLLETGQADQKGLYLPIYEKKTLLEFLDLKFENAKTNAKSQLEKNGII